MKLERSTWLPARADTCIRAVKTPALLQAVAAPLIRFVPVSGHWPARWEPGRYAVQLNLFGWLPLGEQYIVISYPDGKDFSLRDNGHSPLIARWDHLITLVPEGDGCRYTDRLEIEASWRTPFVWVFAWLFYRHRQRRWLALARAGRLEDFAGA